MLGGKITSLCHKPIARVAPERRRACSEPVSVICGRMGRMSKRSNPRAARRPNVVWVFGDQHRAHATSYRGDGNVFTPNIGNLAREGMRFDCAVAGAPWCAPFRGALLTGRYPHQERRGGQRLPPAAGHAHHGACIRRGRLPHRLRRQVTPGRHQRPRPLRAARAPRRVSLLDGQRRRQQPARVLRVRHRQRDAGAAARLTAT